MFSKTKENKKIVRGIISSGLIILGLILFGVSAYSQVYQIRAKNCTISVNKVRKNVNDLISSNSAITWENRKGNQDVYLEYTDLSNKKIYTIRIERKYYMRTGARTIGEYIKKCASDKRNKNKYIDVKSLKTKGTQLHIKENDNVMLNKVIYNENIELDSATYMNVFMPTVEVDSIGRYKVEIKDGRYRIFDTWKKVSVTTYDFDVLYFAQRNEYETRIEVVFIMQKNNEVGIIIVNEANNEYEIQVCAGAPKLKL